VKDSSSSRPGWRLTFVALAALVGVAAVGTAVYAAFDRPINAPATALQSADRLGPPAGSTTGGAASTVPQIGCAPRPSACGYPDATNTGVPAGVGLVSVPDQQRSGPGWAWDDRGWLAVTGDGAVLDGLLVRAAIDVTADNITIRNTRIITSGEGWGVALRHTANVTIQDSEIFSPEATGNRRLMVGIKDIYGDSTGLQILRNEIYHTSTGVQIEGGLIADNYIHDLGYKAGDHLNGTTSNGGTRALTIRHNTIFNQRDQTDAISLFQDFGNQGNRTIENNLVAGGGYTVYGGGGSQTTFNIRIVNNRFARTFHPRSGYFGAVAAFERTGPGNVWSGNVWDDTGQPVTP
jgi:hypothetical protein